MNKKFRKLILPLSIFASLQAQSMGLGTLQVQSILDEELKGNIPLVLDGSEDLETLKVSLASEADYQKVGLDKSYVPSNIHVKLAGSDSNKVIQLTSKGPVSEPIVSLLIVVDWSNGHLLREYTLLLDPPLFNSSQIQKNYSDPVETQSYEAPKKIETTQKSKPQTNFKDTSSTNNSSFSSANQQVVVEAGDTLWNIASRYNTGYSSPQQMMVAIFNNNPTAFQNNDMNFLKKGALLDIPNSDDVSLVSKGEAIAEVKTQINNWSRLNSQDDTGSSNNSGASVDYGIELVPPSDSDSSNSSSGSGSQSRSSAIAELKTAKEQLASSTLENEELSSRVLELEQIVKDQEMAISLKDDDLALLQKQLTESSTSSDQMTDDVWDTTKDSTAAVNSEEMASEDSMSEDTMTSDTMSEDSMSEDTMTTDTMSEDSMSEDTMTSDTMIEDSMSEDSNDLQIADVNESETNQDVSTQVETSNTTPAIQEKSLMDKLLDFKMYILAALGALLLAIVGFVFYKRKNSDNPEPESGSFYENEDDASLDNFNSPQDELNLSNLEDDLVDDLEEELDLSLDTEPEVVVMDEGNDEDSDDDIEEEIDLNVDEMDLDLDDLDELSELDEDSDDEASDQDNTELSDLEFNVDDLNLDDEIPSESGEIEEESATEEKDTSEDNEFEDLSLDFNLDDLETEETKTDDTEESDDTLLGEDFDLELDDDSEEIELEDVIEEGEELEDLVFDTGERTVVPESTGEETEQEVEDLEFDLDDDLFTTDDLELDVNNEENDTEEEKSDELNVAASIPTDDDETEFDLGLDFDEIVEDDAIDTKLDLAKAYFEMGDIDGAKQMVTEIISEGNDDQKAKAEQLKEEIENA